MPRTVYYVAVSVDGFIADKDGGVGWLDPYNSPELGYESFLERVGAVVIGRSTYEQMQTFGQWPYEGRSGLIITSRPLPNLPSLVRSVTVAELPSALAKLRIESSRHVWIVGGGQTARECLSSGLVDELELYVIPTLLGAGIPLLSLGTASIPLRLLETHAFPSGITKLRYEVQRHGESSSGTTSTVGE